MGLKLKWDGPHDRVVQDGRTGLSEIAPKLASFESPVFRSLREVALMREPRPKRKALCYLSLSSLSPNDVVQKLSGIALEPEEELVLQALQISVLQIIEPTIERIVPLPIASPRLGLTGARGGVMIGLQGTDRRVPIGTMGEKSFPLSQLQNPC